MEALTDLAYLLNRYAIRDIDVIANPERKKSKEDSRYWEFYEGLRKGKWKNEDEIAKAFKYDSKGDKGYRRLKEGFKERVLATLLFIDMDSEIFSSQEIKLAELSKLTAIAVTLKRRGARELFIEIGEKAMNLALETNNTIATLQLASILINFYALLPKYSKEFIRVVTIMEKYSELAYWETQAQLDFSLFVSEVSQKKGYNKALSLGVKMKYEKYVGKLAENKNLGFNKYARQLGVLEHLLRHQWEEALLLCEEAIELFHLNGSNDFENMGLFASQKAGCLIMLGKYQEAIDSQDYYINKFELGHSRWYKNREVTTIACFYGQNYTRAWEIVQTALKGERFSTISEVSRETWRLFEGYLNIIARIEGTGLKLEDTYQFRLSKLLNEMPIHSQDKRGGNIPLLILQVHFLLSELKTNKNALDEIQNRLEALRKYAGRNLDSDEEHLRTTLFIQMLLLLPKYIHKPSELRKAAHDHLQKMGGIEALPLDSSFETEVVPYERQWGWIMEFVEAAYGTR
jgi:hypothetical protein